MWVFLSGPMGSGKSTIAALTAGRLGVPHYDLDARIEARTNQTIAEFFASKGEAAFRDVEAEALMACVRDDFPGVLALGGGTVVNQASRQVCLDAGVVITLSASVDELARRVGSGEGRPLLASHSPKTALRRLLETRESVYGEAHHRIDTTDRRVEEVAEEVQRVAQRRPEVMALGSRSYPIYIGAGARRDLGWIHANRCNDAAIFWVTDERVRPLWAQEFQKEFDPSAGLGDVTIPAGEPTKSLNTVERIWDASIEAGLDRRSVLMALGGGVVGDLGGFAASTLYRGVRFAALPTTLLAMVDSSVGGKTGFNRPAGKNLIGSFHQPQYVVCDTDTLTTLAPRDYRAGLGEVVKSAWLAGNEAVAALEGRAEALTQRDPKAVSEAVRMSVRLKASVVRADERESGPRALLNLGHTIGHAIEAASGFGAVLHGEAVALGLVAAMRVGSAAGVTSQEDVARCTRLLEALGLPTDVDAHLGNTVFDAIDHDKKRVGDKIRFILAHGPGDCRIHELGPQQIAQYLC